MTAATLLTVEQVPLDQLRLDPANPRRISEEELDSLERSIREFGFVGSVTAWEERRVRARRRRAAADCCSGPGGSGATMPRGGLSGG